jgi:hypothetical protein
MLLFLAQNVPFTRMKVPDQDSLLEKEQRTIKNIEESLK